MKEITKPMKIVIVIFFFLLLIHSIIFSQEINPLGPSSVGVIPEFICSKSTSSLKLANKSSNDINKKPKQMQDFYANSDASIRFLFSSGKVLFGDYITEYLNEIVLKILDSNNIDSDMIQLFCLKSCSMNAFSTANGLIFINIGLIAKMESEDELAFVIAHEMAHYFMNHPVNSFNLKNVIDDIKDLNYEERIRILSRQSRELEIEADSIAIRWILKTGYKSSSIISALDKINYYNLPLGQEKFDSKFFNDDTFYVPNCFYKAEMNDIIFNEDFEDNLLDHPNIKKRKINAKKIIGKNIAINNYSPVDITKFERSKQISSFEFIRLQLINREFADVIYNSFVLIQFFPNNEFLQLNIAKALFALSEYKRNDKFYEIAKPYTLSQGESQQVHYLVKQLTKKQLTSLTIKYIYDLKTNGIVDPILDNMLGYLITSLLSYNLCLSDFNEESWIDDSTNNQNSNAKIDDKILYQQKNMRNFYKKSLYKAIKDSSFINMFSYYQSVNKNKNLVDYQNSINKTEEKLNDTIILCNLEYMIFDRNIKFNFCKSEKNKQNTLEKLSRAFCPQINSFDILLLDSLKCFEINRYNLYCNYQEILQELDNNYTIIPFCLGSYECLLSNKALMNISLIANPKHKFQKANIYNLNGNKKFERYYNSKKNNDIEKYITTN